MIELIIQIFAAIGIIATGGVLLLFWLAYGALLVMLWLLGIGLLGLLLWMLLGMLLGRRK